MQLGKKKKRIRFKKKEKKKKGWEEVNAHSEAAAWTLEHKTMISGEKEVRSTFLGDNY